MQIAEQVLPRPPTRLSQRPPWATPWARVSAYKLERALGGTAYVLWRHMCQKRRKDGYCYLTVAELTRLRGVCRHSPTQIKRAIARLTQVGLLIPGGRVLVWDRKGYKRWRYLRGMLGEPGRKVHVDWVPPRVARWMERWDEKWGHPGGSRPAAGRPRRTPLDPMLLRRRGMTAHEARAVVAMLREPEPVFRAWLRANPGLRAQVRERAQRLTGTAYPTRSDVQALVGINPRAAKTATKIVAREEAKIPDPKHGPRRQQRPKGLLQGGAYLQQFHGWTRYQANLSVKVRQSNQGAPLFLGQKRPSPRVLHPMSMNHADLEAVGITGEMKIVPVGEGDGLSKQVLTFLLLPSLRSGMKEKGASPEGGGGSFFYSGSIPVRPPPRHRPVRPSGQYVTLGRRRRTNPRRDLPPHMARYLPPFPSLRHVPVLPEFPALDPADPPERHRSLLASWYTEILERHYRKRVWTFKHGPERSKYKKLLTEAAEAFIAEDLEPIRWILWRLDWWTDPTQPKGKSKLKPGTPIPVPVVFGPKAIRKHAGWCEQMVSTGGGKTLHVNRRMRRLVREWRAWQRKLRLLPPTTPESVVRRMRTEAFSGHGYEVELRLAHKFGQKWAEDRKAKVEAGQWLPEWPDL